MAQDLSFTFTPACRLHQPEEASIAPLDVESRLGEYNLFYLLGTLLPNRRHKGGYFYCVVGHKGGSYHFGVERGHYYFLRSTKVSILLCGWHRTGHYYCVGT